MFLLYFSCATVNQKSTIEDSASELINETDTSSETQNEENDTGDTGSADTDSVDTDSSSDTETITITDFTQTGPYAVSVENKSTSVTDCSSMEYSVFTPIDSVAPPVMVLGHGFARGADKMLGHAEHFASWGVEVLVPTLCHYGFFGVDHEMNGQNMVELANVHGATTPLYAGQSAGGLASIIAASIDQNAAGVLGLDATDTEGIPSVPDFIGQQYAASVSGVGMALIGEPSSCNQENNGITLFQMMSQSHILKVISSDHCDYENPTNWGCTTLCSNQNNSRTDEEITPVIMQLATAATMKLTGLNTDGERYWNTPVLDTMITSGSVQIIE